MLPTSVGVELATFWSPVGQRIQLSHWGRLFQTAETHATVAAWAVFFFFYLERFSYWFTIFSLNIMIPYPFTIPILKCWLCFIMLLHLKNCWMNSKQCRPWSSHILQHLLWVYSLLRHVCLNIQGDIQGKYSSPTVCLLYFGLYLAHNNLSVLLRRCLVVEGSTILTFWVLTHWNITSQALNKIFHQITLYWHWVDQFS